MIARDWLFWFKPWEKWNIFSQNYTYVVNQQINIDVICFIIQGYSKWLSGI